MVEMLLIPADSVISTVGPIGHTQFGFREIGLQGICFGCALSNDFQEQGSPAYIGRPTLDAEKCFDSVWHDGCYINSNLPYQ